MRVKKFLIVHIYYIKTIIFKMHKFLYLKILFRMHKFFTFSNIKLGQQVFVYQILTKLTNKTQIQ